MGIGDETVVTGQCRHLQERDHRKIRIVYEKPRWHDIWNGNPRIAQPGENGDFQEFRPRNGYKRPYIAGKNEKRWTWQRWGPEWGGSAPVGEIYLTEEEREFGSRFPARVYIEPHLKHGASPNKAWSWARWQELARLLLEAGLPVAQLGPPGLPGMPGVEQIRTASARQAAALLETARGAVLPEGGLHHIAAAVGAPATVVIFGCYIGPDVTGYATQKNMFTGEGLGCGWRIPSKCCQTAMANIEPERVTADLLRLLSGETAT